jgi:hypothetical protein
MVRNLSVEAAKGFADESFDWLYIDALHTASGLAADLEAWWPKLRKLGLLSGDDYGTSRNDRGDDLLMTEARMRAGPLRRTPYGNIPKQFKWGVIEALHDFCARHSVELHVTWCRPAAHSRSPSFRGAHVPLCVLQVPRLLRLPRLVHCKATARTRKGAVKNGALASANWTQN